MNIVAEYRIKPDRDNKLRDAIIKQYIGLANSLAARFVTPRHNHDDVCEIAQFALVRAVIAAKKSLEDNNIKYYLIKSIRFKLYNYVSLDHLVVLSGDNGLAWKRKKNVHRCPLKDCVTTKQDTSVLVDDFLESCITSEIQRDVVELRLANFRFREIGEKLNLQLIVCQRYWYEFRALVKERLDGSSLL